jgi:hypothetical protein
MFMKKILFLAFLLLIQHLSFAEESEVLRYNEENVDFQLSPVTQLEKDIYGKDEGETEQYLASHSEFATNFLLESALNKADSGELPVNIPPFWWGFCLSWVGLLIVFAVTDNDKNQVRKAFMGCLVSGGCIALFYIAYGVLVATSYSGWWWLLAN